MVGSSIDGLKRCVLAVFILGSAFLQAQTHDKIKSILGSVNTDSLKETVNILSGEKEFYHNAGMNFIRSRHKDNSDNALAAEYLKMRLRSYGLKPYGQDFLAAGQNVYAYQYGKERPHYVVIFCAHYDDMPSGSYAPGADDNASGTAAVLEAARILSEYSTKYTVLYALWDQEEQGLQGSNYFAQQNAIKNEDTVLAVINLDMIAYDSNNDSEVEIHTRNVAKSVELAQAMVGLNTEFNIGLEPVIINPGTDRSDHSPFWNEGISAILLIEDFTKNSNGVSDFNPYYHQTTDRIDNFNMFYFTANTKLALATLIQKAGIYSGETEQPPFYYSLSQNFPNPFNSETMIRYQLPKDGQVTLKVYDILGREVEALAEGYQYAGYHTVSFPSGKSNLSSGIYFYILSAENFISTKKMILIK